MTEPPPRLDATYLLPIRREQSGHERELAGYLTSLRIDQIIVVDGSPSDVFDRLHAALTPEITHVRPDSTLRGLNGKVRGVLTGLQQATHERVVIADDDVRYDENALQAVIEELDEAEVVRPQNYFSPAPWHATLDGARSLINRSLDGDWPGTLAIRKSALPTGYNADVLFENLELVRTIRANGGRERVARDLYVRRLPPTSKHYCSQRVRQAYDEFARPERLVAALTVVPLLIVGLALKTPVIAEALAIGAIALALIGWLRVGAWKHFSPLSVVTAPLWLLERGLCAWIAVYQRFAHGGMLYAGNVIRDAATPPVHPTRPTP